MPRHPSFDGIRAFRMQRDEEVDDRAHPQDAVHVGMGDGREPGVPCRRGQDPAQGGVRGTVSRGGMPSWHFALRGSHLGPFTVTAATGRTFRVEAIYMLRLEDGSVAEHWGVIDTAARPE